MLKLTILAAILLCLSIPLKATAQMPYDEGKFRVYFADGRPAVIGDVLAAAAGADAIFLGELHDDGVAHAIQAKVFRRLVDQHSGKRKVALSLEMFERDVQIVVDEYLAGLISENHFLLSSRPWPNYKTDYRPLVELAKEKRLPVIAANAPRRYINMVSRGGRAALDKLSKDALRSLPPLPFGEPSAAYSSKFKGLMGNAPEARVGLDNILASQTLWDAAMAHAVARFLEKNDGGLVVHLNGGFHTESRLGTVEHLAKYRSRAKAIVVTMKPDANFTSFDAAKHLNVGDFVILTEPKKTS